MTAARRNGGLGGAILKMLAAREAGRRTVLVEAEAERSGGPEEERPLRLRRLGFYARNGCTPVYESFNCGLLCQVFVLGPAPADRADLKAAHRAIYGPARTDVVIDSPPARCRSRPTGCNRGVDMIQLQVCFCLLGLALAALGTAVLLRPQRLRRFLRRLDARLWKWTGRRLAWSRLAGSALLLLGTVLFLVLLAALLLRALY